MGMAAATPLLRPFLLLLLLLLIAFPTFSSSQQQPWSAVQLSSSESRALFRLRRQLEYPSALSSLTNSFTPLCSLPPTPNLTLACSPSGHLTALSITGDKPRLLGSSRNTLGANFSAVSIFATISRFTALTNLSLVSLGMWGTLPTNINRRLPVASLTSLNLSSNYLYGPIPPGLPGLAALVELDLSRNALAGDVPDLSAMPALRTLDLSENRLGPDWPLLPEAGTLVSLAVGNNSFNCPLPTGPDHVQRRLGQLQTFDARYNRLSGQVPPELLALPSLRRLVLAGNALTGGVLSPDGAGAEACGAALELVDLSGNRLVGALPDCLSRVRVVVDAGNCLAPPATNQHSTAYCNELPLALRPHEDESGAAGEHKGRNLGKVLGAVFGAIGGVAVVGLILALYFRRKKKNHRTKTMELKEMEELESMGWDLPTKKCGSPVSHPYGGKIVPELRLGVHGVLAYRSFGFAELEEMTNHFDQMNLVKGCSQDQDELYKGWLQDGSAVMVRCLRLKPKLSVQNLRQFTSLTSKLQHNHLVSVLGHCVDEDGAQDTTTIYLVFEHVSNGTLRSHLDEWRKREMLKWPQRVAAVIGVARGVQFLHSVAAPGICGNDIRLENVLMSESLSVKISNYRLPIPPNSKNEQVASGIGTLGSPRGGNPGGVQNRGGDDKEDIYNLGLIMLELVTGRHATAPSDWEVLKQQLQRTLTEGPVELQDLIDAAILGTFTYESLKTVAQVALNCLSPNLNHRPSIDDVLWNLQYSAQAQYACASSENLSVNSCTTSTA